MLDMIVIDNQGLVCCVLFDMVRQVNLERIELGENDLKNRSLIYKYYNGSSINHSEIFDQAQNSTASCQLYIPLALHDILLLCELESTQNRFHKCQRSYKVQHSN